MAKDKPLYISVDPINYKSNRANMLNSQIDLLNSMKHLHSLKQIKDEKFKLKMRLYSLFSSVMADMEKLDLKLPEVEIAPEKREKPAPAEKPVKIDTRKQGMEDELREIQEKLKRLNAR